MQEHYTDIDHDHDHDDHDHGHDGHEHDHDLEEHEGHGEHGHGGHGHEHGRVDADLYGNRAGLRAVQISTAGMFIVAAIQFAIAEIGGSAGLFADALHNLGDVLTTVALWIAFVIDMRAANPRYTYGYHRSEDLAGIFIELVIIAIAIAGLVITVVILTVVYSTTRSVLQRLLDAVDSRVVPSIVSIASEVPGVEAVNDVRARWVGHTLNVAMNIEVDAELTLVKAHAIAEEVRHRLFHRVKGLSEAIIHTDPHSHDEDYHQLVAHHMEESQRPVVERW